MDGLLIMLNLHVILFILEPGTTFTCYTTNLFRTNFVLRFRMLHMKAKSHDNQTSSWSCISSKYFVVLSLHMPYHRQGCPRCAALVKKAPPMIELFFRLTVSMVNWCQKSEIGNRDKSELAREATRPLATKNLVLLVLQ